MSFKEIQDLNCDVTIALGGQDRKNNRPNPTKIEGYYIGSKDTPSRKSKNGIAKLHILQTAKGNVGVWGKTDLDRKMATAPIGAMLRITQSGTVPTPNGDMYKFKVEVDSENTIEVSFAEDAAPAPTAESYDEYPTDDGDVLGEEASVEEAPVARAVPPKKAAPAADAARRAKVQELLAGTRNKS